MKFLQFKLSQKGEINIGLLVDDKVINLNASDNNIPHSLVEFIAQENAMFKAKSILTNPKQVVKLSEVQLLSPIIKPDKVAGVGLNYKEHCDELKLPYPKEPIVFSKFSSTITGPFDDIVLPESSKAVDWEVELAVVIGKKAKNVPLSEAYNYILGYTVAQDLTARDWMDRNGGQFLLSKTMDTFCPLGPVIVTKDEIKDPHNLNLKTWVNGVLKQNGNSKEIIYKIDFLVSHLSSLVTLYPGDLILTGTPSGVGFFRNPPEFLRKGDVIESEIEGIGKIRNNVV